MTWAHSLTLEYIKQYTINTKTDQRPSEFLTPPLGVLL